ncbi:MAG: CaiB/BaiF CoA transferase family protein [bacterium]
MMTTRSEGTGPLSGLKVVEIAGIGPAPHACMLLADLGADIIRIERRGGDPLGGGPTDFLTRGRPSVALDLKHPAAVGTVLDLVEQADLLVEGMRPGTMERLGLGPDACWKRNPGLVYGRMTGWGQTGPWADSAGHDLTYIAVTGALDTFGQDPNRPHFPSNLVGDFGGGSTYLVIGLLAALHEASSSGRGQVVDAAIVDGTAHLNAMASGFRAAGQLQLRRASNLLDGGQPYYDVYETADGRHVAVGALEPKFYAELVRRLALEDLPDRSDPGSSDEIRRRLAAAFASQPLAHWQEVFAGTDACVAPVLTLDEAPHHPHLAARGVFVEVDGHVQPAPAPRFSRTPAELTTPPAAEPGQHTRAALEAWGVTDVDALLATGAAVQA